MRLILASASPRRAELLTAAGFVFDVCAADVDETVLPGEAPRDYVRRLAQDKAAKALALVGGTEDVLVIAADTAVIVGDVILGKPVDDVDAARMLQQISGRQHVVMTGVCVRTRSGQETAVEETRVQVAALSEDQISWYVASGEGRDKAGGYAIQGLASRFVPKIEGSYSNVVGLPVALVDELVRRVGGGIRVLASNG